MRVVFTSPDRAQAEHFADSLEQQGYRTKVVSTSVSGDARRYLVRVINESDAEEITT